MSGKGEDFAVCGRKLYKRDLKDRGAKYERVFRMEEANLVGSQLKVKSRLHRPVIDLDFPCRLIPSSTEGHFHLYLDGIDVEWPKYKDLLIALAAAGVISKGYLEESLNKGFTAVRLPHVKKEEGDINSSEIKAAMVETIRHEGDWINNFTAAKKLLEEVYLDQYLTGEEKARYRKAVKEEDFEAVGHLLHRAWVALPDTPQLLSMPLWNEFCALCSERWVFRTIG